jgi:hypothetical protein
MRRSFLASIASVTIAVAFLSTTSTPVRAQVRGVYPPGMSALNSGVTPDSGFSYNNLLLYYARNEFKGPRGEILATGAQSVIMDMNSLVWVSRRELLGGAKFSMSATLPFARNSLTNDATGPVSGGGGFADSYYQPFILGWSKSRVAFRAVYGFLAPTGRFVPGAKDNVGSGYWTHALASAQTFYLSKDKRTSISTFQLYEIHTKQQSTNIQPGQTMNLDYSVLHTIPLSDQANLQMGLVGYGQWQTTDKTGPGISSEQSKAHYRVNAAGFSASIVLPKKGMSFGARYFNEFLGRSTFQGYSVQASASIRF